PQPIDLPPPLTSEGRMPLARGTNLPAIAQQQTGRSRAIGWVFLILVLGLVGSGLVFGRSEVMARVPRTEPVYRAVGLGSVPAPGLNVHVVRFERTQTGGKSEFVVEGTIDNTAPDPLVVPVLRASLLDANGHEVASWNFNIDRPELQPDESVNFSATYADPP